MDNIQRFFENRAQFTLQHMRQHLELRGELREITLNISGKGNIQINTVIPTFIDGKWSGKYYSDFPITLTVIDNSGSFKGWKGDVESTDKTISVTLTKDMNIVANFE
jgi:hypothetical protein